GGPHVGVRVGPVDELPVLPDLLDLGDRHLGALSERVVVLVRRDRFPGAVARLRQDSGWSGAGVSLRRAGRTHARRSRAPSGPRGRAERTPPPPMDAPR